MPIIGPENVNSAKLHYIMAQKTRYNDFFFSKNCPKIPYNNRQKKLSTTSKYPIISNKKTSKTSVNYNNTLKYPIIYKKKIKKQPTSFFGHYNTSVAKIQGNGAQKNHINIQ